MHIYEYSMSISMRNLCSVHISNQSDSQPGMYVQCILVISLIARNVCSVHICNQSDRQECMFSAYL